jgi:outer membrane protein assembly factor BamD
LKKTLALIATLLFTAVACSSNRNDAAPRAIPNAELLNLSKEEIYTRADALYAEKKWVKSRNYYSHVYENYPNDPLGRRSLLRVADTYYKQNDPVNLVEAQYKYRDFINRYPGSEFADYAMLQIANVAFAQMESADRDQTKTHEAVQKFREMLAAYPNSSHRAEAEEKLQKALDRLARHEHVVAKFYMKRGSWDAAVQRLNGIVEQYPAYEDRAGTFYDLGNALESLGRKGEARLYYERVVAEFPKSDLAGKARQKLENSGA